MYDKYAPTTKNNEQQIQCMSSQTFKRGTYNKKYKINPTTLPKCSTNVKFNYSLNILKPYSIKTTQKIILGLPLSDK